MKGRQTALYPGNEDRVGYWLTPPDLMKRFDDEFHFDFDPCPYPRPAGYDGLKENWGKRNWVNPPFLGGIVPWAKKAVLESERGNLSVLIMPTGSDVALMLEAGAEMRYVGRIGWLKPNGRTMPHPRPQLVFILRGKP